MDFLISIFIWLGALIGIYVPVTVNQQPNVAPTVELRAPVLIEVVSTSTPQNQVPKKETPTVIVTPQQSPIQEATTTPQVIVPPPIVIVVPTPTPVVPEVVPQPVQVPEEIVTPAPIQTPPIIPLPTEAQAKPKITLEGVRDGDVVTFSWSTSGYKEPVQCKVNGEPVSQEVRSKVVTSAELYTLTLACVGTKSASQSEESLTQ